MRAAAALLWIEARRIVLDLAAVHVLVLVGAAIPWILHALGAPTSPRSAVPALLGAAVIPLVAAILGATVFASDPAREWVAARPLRPSTAFVLRIGMRLVVLFGVVALAFFVTLPSLSPRLGIDAARFGMPVHDGAGALLVTWWLAFFAAAVVAGALTRRALAAVVGAMALVGLAVLVAWPLSVFVRPVAAAFVLGVTIVLTLVIVAGARGQLAARRLSGRRFAGALAIGSASVAFLALAAWAGAAATSHLVARDGLREWEQRFGSAADLEAAHPLREAANAPALELEAVARDLGFSLTPRHREVAGGASRVHGHGVHPAPLSVLREYAWDEVRRPEADVTTPPVEVRKAVAEIAPGLDQLRALLLSGDEPLWEKRATEARQLPLPNLSGHLHAIRLLVADAFVATHLGDVARAKRDLEAAWRLNEALRRDRPELISQLIALAGARTIARAVTKVPVDPGAWESRLVAEAFRVSILEGLAVESRWKLVGSPEADWHVAREDGIGAILSRPWLRLAMAREGRDDVESALALLQWGCEPWLRVKEPRDDGSWSPGRTASKRLHLLALEQQLARLARTPIGEVPERVAATHCDALWWEVNVTDERLVIELRSRDGSPPIADDRMAHYPLRLERRLD